MSSTRRRQFLLAASGLAAGLAGCTAARERVGDVRRSPPERRVASDWRPEPGTWAEREYGPTNSRHNPHATPPRTEPEIDWERDLEHPIGDGTVVVAEETVYLSTRRRLLALDADDGTMRWDRDLGDGAGLKYVDGRLYQLNWGLRRSELVARSPGGDERWRTAIPDYLVDVHERDGYLFVSGRNRYWTLHADTGEIVREREDWLRRIASDGDRLYAAYSDILVGYDVDGRTLEERWRSLSDLAPESGHPVVADDQIFVPAYHPTGTGGGVFVSDLSGEKRHRIELEQGPRYLVDTEDGPVAVPSSNEHDGELVALRTDGSQRWTAAIGARARAIAAGETVYAGTSPLTALDATSGERLWEWDAGVAVRLAATNSTLYVVTADRIVALRT